MSKPDLKTVPYEVLLKTDDLEIRAMESYTVAETAMMSGPFDLGSSGQGFNVLAEYLFGR